MKSRHDDYYRVEPQIAERINLIPPEFEIILEAATKLHNFHKERGAKKQKLRNTFLGLKAEYAAVKFFNYRLGCIPRIAFRTDYEDGKDGGIDFSFHGANFDVKHAWGRDFSRKLINRTGSHFLIFCSTDKSLQKRTVEILGFAPVASIRDHTVGISALNCNTLRKYWPDNMIGPVKFQNPWNRFHRIDSIIQNVFRQLEALQESAE